MKIGSPAVLDDVKRALDEDIGSGDISASLLPKDLKAKAEIISREPMLLCGQRWVDTSFAQINSQITVNWFFPEGKWLDKQARLCEIAGSLIDILTAERTALNFLQTLSGTATQAYHYLLKLKGSKTQLLDTRKTLPGLRLAQKYAVACAGGKNHRLGLYDAFLIKENHIKAWGSITKALQQARQSNPDKFLEIEVENLDELHEALLSKPDRILLDNFTLIMLKEAMAIKLALDPACPLEASGNITLANISEFASTGVDYISIGAITKSIRAIDLSLLVRDVQ